MSEKSLESRIIILETEILLLKGAMRRLQELTQPSKLAQAADVRERRYDELIAALHETIEETTIDGIEMEPAEIIAALEKNGFSMAGYSASDHGRKLVLGRALRRMGMRAINGAEGGRAYAVRRIEP